MALKLIKQLLDENKKQHLINGALVIDEASGKSFAPHLNDKSVHLTEADIDAKMSALSRTVNDFLTGEANGGEVDRLVELVSAIGENKDSIDALVSGNATKEELAEVSGKVEALSEKSHSHENSAILNGVSANESGDLVFNGKTLDGATSVAFIGDSEASPVFSGKLVMLVEAYTAPKGINSAYAWFSGAKNLYSLPGHDRAA